MNFRNKVQKNTRCSYEKNKLSNILLFIKYLKPLIFLKRSWMAYPYPAKTNVEKLIIKKINNVIYIQIIILIIESYSNKIFIYIFRNKVLHFAFSGYEYAIKKAIYSGYITNYRRY